MDQPLLEPAPGGAPVDASPAAGRVRVYGDDGAFVPPAEAARFSVALDDDREPLERAFARGDRDAGTLYGLAAARLHAGSPEDAREPLELLLAAHPRREAAHELAAEVAEALGDLAGARAIEERLLAAAPADGERHARLARLLMLAGEGPAARRRFEQGAAAMPRHFECARRAALLALGAGEAARALELLERFLAATGDPRDPVLVDVRVEEPQIHARDLGSRLAFAEAERRVRGRRSFEVAAERFQARVLIGHAERARGDEAAALAAYDAAQDELAAVPDALLAEVAWRLGLEAADLRALVAARRGRP